MVTSVWRVVHANMNLFSLTVISLKGIEYYLIYGVIIWVAPVTYMIRSKDDTEESSVLISTRVEAKYSAGWSVTPVPWIEHHVVKGFWKGFVFYGT